MKTVISLISFAIVLGGFLYGAFHIFRGRKPLYFRLLVCSAGCFALEELSVFINFLTDGFEYYITLGVLGVFGAILFLLSANFGALDSIVDENKENGKIRLLSLSAPAVLSVLLIHIAVNTAVHGLTAAVLLFLALFPVVPASYYSLKHLLLPFDPLGILKCTRIINVFSLVFYFSETAMFLIFTESSVVDVSVLNIITALSSAGVSVFAVKGEKAWIK